MFVVTGATGHLGRLIVRELLTGGAQPDQVVAGGRDVGRLGDLAGLGVRTATVDYDDPAGMREAFAGAQTLVLVSGSEIGRRTAQHGAAIDAAKAAGVRHIVYTSGPHADTSPLIVNPEHKATEELLAASGLPYTAARDNWYTENYEQTFAQAAATGVVLTSAGDGRVASAPRADYAAAIAALALRAGDETSVHELTGDVAWSFDEFAAAASQALGRPVEHRAVSPEEHRTALLAAGLDEGTVGFVLAMDANIADGLLANATDEVRSLIGRPTTPLLETLRTWA
ncbi:MAG: NAD(P)H-binding protein [Actinomycetales bacterium]|nr:NAD(P)H-binding protein [Actinomycetales bacterium]